MGRKDLKRNEVDWKSAVGGVEYERDGRGRRRIGDGLRGGSGCGEDECSGNGKERRKSGTGKQKKGEISGEISWSKSVADLGVVGETREWNGVVMVEKWEWVSEAAEEWRGVKQEIGLW